MIYFEDGKNTKISSGLSNESLRSNLDLNEIEANIGSAIRPLNKNPILLKIKNNIKDDKLLFPFNELSINMIKYDG